MEQPIIKIMNKIMNCFTKELYSYDNKKVTILKAILPFLIIIHHIANMGFQDLYQIGLFGDIAMYIFFAMSGYGVVISYINNPNYINKFLKKSIVKLYVPYFIALLLFIVYRKFKGIDQFELLLKDGLYSFVPTSWYIYVLSYFYVFYYIVFKYTKKTSLLTKVLLVSLLVLAYCVIAPRIGVECWRYNRCPAFCVGMTFALFDKYMKSYFVKWQVFVLIFVFILLFPFRAMMELLPSLYYATLFFLVMYIVPNVREYKLPNFISSISLEIFIIQYIAIYLIINDLHLKQTGEVVIGVILVDIFIACIMYKIDEIIAKNILKRIINNK